MDSMDGTKSIEVRVDMRFGEIYRATLGLTLRALKYLIGAVAVLTMLCGVGYVYLRLGGQMSDVVEAAGYFIFTVLEGAVPALIVVIPIISCVRVRQVFRAEAGSLTRRYLFSANGIDVQSPQVNAQVHWTAVREVGESRRFFLLYLLPTMANVLPKRCFASDAILKDFRAMIRANVKKTRLQG